MHLVNSWLPVLRFRATATALLTVENHHLDWPTTQSHIDALHQHARASHKLKLAKLMRCQASLVDASASLAAQSTSLSAGLQRLLDYQRTADTMLAQLLGR
jgi:hypothetical protein